MSKSIFYPFLRTRNLTTFLFFYRKYVFAFSLNLLLASKKCKTFAKKNFRIHAKKYVSLHQLDMHQIDCTKSILHQVDMHQVDAPSRLHQVDTAPSRNFTPKIMIGDFKTGEHNAKNTNDECRPFFQFPVLEFSICIIR